jgi:queuine/archaeosine tRNA-ribosyltransferase
MNEFLFDFPERPKRRLETASGVIDYPAYIPVTTFGDAYPLDALIQPYLPRLAPAVMVSFHYAQAMKKKPRIPVLIDSGGFAALFQGAEIVEEHGLGILRVPDGDKIDELTPMRVLDFQEQHADVAFTLDFPIPPDMDRHEADRRMRLTCVNAIWALENRRRKEMRLFACVQGLDAVDYLQVAGELAGHAFDGFAIGGLVPRARDRDLIEAVVVGVLERIGDRPLHVFGMGKPETTQRLFDLGVDSVDSSSYVKMAADGKTWAQGTPPDDPATTDRLLLALSNLAEASKDTPFGRQRGMLLREPADLYAVGL